MLKTAVTAQSTATDTDTKGVSRFTQLVGVFMWIKLESSINPIMVLAHGGAPSM